MAKARVALYFDTVSPYTHFALHTWRRYVPAIWPDVELALKPIFLGGVMQATGNQPPGTLAARAAYMVQDLQRSASLCDVPMLETPSNFFSEVARKIIGVQRVLCAADLQGHSTSEKLDLACAFSDAVHAEKSLRTDSNDLALGDAFYRSALSRCPGIDGDALVTLSGSGEAKALLRANTDAAVENGAFGSPTAIVTRFDAQGATQGEPMLIFGSDRFEQLAHVLELPYRSPQPHERARL